MLSLTLLAHAILLAPLAAQAASFVGCIPGTTAHRTPTALQLSAIEGTDCIDQCTTRGFEYSYSYFWDADHMHYCQCGSEEDLLQRKESLHLSYEGERCFEGDATIYHLPSDFRYTHSIDQLTLNKLPVDTTLGVKSFPTPGACFEHCLSSDRVFVLSPAEGDSDENYQCLCDSLAIEEQGMSTFNDATTWRRFDKPIATHRLVFQQPLTNM